jgi:hypothetical protein
LLVLAAGTLPLAGCGSSSPNTGGSTAARGSSADANKALTFAECMRSHGVPNFPDPTGGRINLQIQRTPNSMKVNGVEVNGPAFQSAMQACHSQLPNGGKGPAGSNPAARQAALKFSQCMRSHGVSGFPDPVFHGPAVGIQLNPGTGIDPSSPAFKAAQQACQSVTKGGFFGTDKAP